MTDDFDSRVFIESCALEQVVTIHPGMAEERADLVSRQVKPVEGQGVTSGWDDSAPCLPFWSALSSQYDWGPTVRRQSSHMKRAP
ncbi:hypothetical protein TNCV_2569631 [Trichonephila clavipes]|nr:hypothetical protein TNCV_2569631 [Trichonephila clavipes]